MGPTDNINYIDIPDDAVIIKQSIWAWLLMAVPWVLFFLISLIVDFLTFGILPIILAAAMIVPRYISSNKTSYILVENYIIVDQGGGRRIDIPINDIDFVTLKHGMFGRTLGYATFLLNLKVSTQQDIVDEINSILPIPYIPQTKFKDLELHITKFSKNSPDLFNQPESKKTNKIIDSNSNIIEDDVEENN
ncbi:MAG: hypothetical protein ACJ0A6_01285 [Dehalococcoidia bacterium]